MEIDRRTIRRLRFYMAAHCDEYDYATQLAEAAADEFQLYEDPEYAIPEVLFEMAMEFKPID